jgi:glyoxylase-like metal-dependent hydrolase (beta-lactamase superfamily II)
MFFHQRFIPGLAIASYMVGDEKAKSVAVIDHTRDVDEYVRIAKTEGLHITHILETHVHADYVSGSAELKARLGGKPQIVCSGMGGKEWTPPYADVVVEDGDEVKLGGIRLKAMHTPGHRPEHTAFLLRDSERGDDPWAVLTGDSLFVGDVARPDLAIEKREGAAGIFRSLHERLLTLPDDVEVWPGHLGGSSCGSAGIDHKSTSTIGFEREHNRALRFESEKEFVEDAVATLGDPPPNVEQIDSSGLRWVNIEHPGALERAWLEEHFDFHALDLEDVLSRRQRPKIDIYDEYLFIVLHLPVFDPAAGRLGAGEFNRLPAHLALHLAQHVGDIGGVELRLQQKGVVPLLGMNRHELIMGAGVLERIGELGLLFGPEADVLVDREDQEGEVGARLERLGQVAAGLARQVERLPDIDDAQVSVGVEARHELLAGVQDVGLDLMLQPVTLEIVFILHDLAARAILHQMKMDETLVRDHPGQHQPLERGLGVVIITTVEVRVFLDGEDLLEVEELVKRGGARAGGDRDHAVGAVVMAHREVERHDSAERAADDSQQLVDPQMVEQSNLAVDDIGDR